MKKKYIFCFDIDNVICKTINKNYKTSKPNKKAIKKINQLYDCGQIIKFFTARYMGRNKENIKKAKKHRLKIKVRGIPAFCSFIFLSKNHNVYRTFITQEMLKKGFLATNVVYASIAHDQKILKKYFKELDIIFRKIKKFETGENIYNYLENKLATETFGRLN